MSDDIMDFVFKELPVGVMVFDRRLDVVEINRAAINFCGRHELPEGVIEILRGIFDAIKKARFDELFPGDIYLSERIPASQSRWTFKFMVRLASEPLVTVFITEESLANRLDLNRIRREKGLTRRETDILRRVLNGLKNAEIAEDLEIAEQTVKDHLSSIYIKFNVKNRFALLSSLRETSFLK